jgi:hypothetical protein
MLDWYTAGGRRQNMRCSCACRPTRWHGVPRIFLTAPLSYAAETYAMPKVSSVRAPDNTQPVPCGRRASTGSAVDTHAKDDVAHLCPCPARLGTAPGAPGPCARQSPPLAPPGGVGARGAARPSGRGVRVPGVRCQGSAGSGGDNATQAAGHHAQRTLVAHAPNSYTQARGKWPQNPERSGQVARPYPETRNGSWTARCEEPTGGGRVPGPLG